MSNHTLQAEVSEWANPIFGTDPLGPILHLLEELHEAHEESMTQECDEEIADCVLIVLHLASLLGIHGLEVRDCLADDVREKFEVCKTRTWAPPDKRGIVRHIKEVAP